MSPRNATEIGQRRVYTFRGKTYPSVTTILRAWPMEWAIAYGAKHVALRAIDELPELVRRRTSEDQERTYKWLTSAPHQRRDAAAGVGTNVHAYLEERAKGAPANPQNAEELAVDQFIEAYRPDFLFVEPQVFSVSEGYAGSADAFVTIYGRRLVIDLKTAPSAVTDQKVRLQLAAYRYGDFIGAEDREIGPVPDCDGAAVLVVPRDDPRSWQLIEVPAGAEEFAVFRATKRLWQFYDSTKGQDIGELILPQSREIAS